MEKVLSPYYPPRAGRCGKLLSRCDAGRRIFHLDRIHLPGGISPFQFLLSLVIPGFSFLARRERIPGWSFLIGYGIAFMVFIAALGHAASTIAYGCMIAAHALSVVHLHNLWFKQASFGFRLAAVSAAMAGAWLFCYHPLIDFAEEHWFIPLRTPRGVVVVDRRTFPESVKPGDWIAYRAASFSGNGYRIEAGFDMEKVMGKAGDRIIFTRKDLRVNGVPYARQPGMPLAAEWVVPEKHWFIWPNLAISVRGVGADVILGEALQANGMISENNLVGKPYRKWCGRRQHP